jgi:hypothetical protein
MTSLGKLVPLGKEPRPVVASTAHDDSSMDEDDFMKQIFDPNLDESPAPTKPGTRPVARQVQHDAAPAAAAFGRPSAKPTQTATSSQSNDALESLVGKKPTNQNTAKADNSSSAAAGNESLSGSSSQPDLHSGTTLLTSLIQTSFFIVILIISIPLRRQEIEHKRTVRFAKAAAQIHVTFEFVVRVCQTHRTSQAC